MPRRTSCALAVERSLVPPAIVRPSRDSPPRSRGAALHAAHMKTATAAAAEILAYVWVGSQARVEVDARQPEARERALENCPEQLLHHEPGLVEGGALFVAGHERPRKALERLACDVRRDHGDLRPQYAVDSLRITRRHTMEYSRVVRPG